MADVPSIFGPVEDPSSQGVGGLLFDPQNYEGGASGVMTIPNPMGAGTITIPRYGRMGTNFYSNSSGRLQIGSHAYYGNTSGEFKGRFEELVFYNSVLYPVTVRDGKYTFTKPLPENNSSASTTNIPYNAKLIIKDYHNIRGHATTAVAQTSNVSFKKAGFRLDNT